MDPSPLYPLHGVDAPNELCCPITHELFADPVVAPDGHTYEKAAIERHVAGAGQGPGQRPRSPMTNEPLGARPIRLVPNHAMKSQAVEWRRTHSGPAAAAAQLTLLRGRLVGAETPQGALEAIAAVSQFVSASDWLPVSAAEVQRLRRIITSEQLTSSEVERELQVLEEAITLKAESVLHKHARLRRLADEGAQALGFWRAQRTRDGAAMRRAKKKHAAAKKKVATAKAKWKAALAAADQAQRETWQVQGRLRQTNAQLAEIEAWEDRARRQEADWAAALDDAGFPVFRVAPSSTSSSSSHQPAKKKRRKVTKKSVGGWQLLSEEGQQLCKTSKTSVLGRSLLEAAASLGQADAAAVVEQLPPMEKMPGQATFELGWTTYYGDGGDLVEDTERGEELIVAAAAEGFPCAMAVCYVWGLGNFALDIGKGFAMANDIALQTGYPQALHFVAALKRCEPKPDKDGVLVLGTDRAGSFKLDRLAAAAGFMPAKYGLSKCYLEGLGVAQDVAKGVALLKEAAEWGHIRAIADLGCLYMFGRHGVEKNIVCARVWFQKGCDKGCPECEDYLEELDTEESSEWSETEGDDY